MLIISLDFAYLWNNPGIFDILCKKTNKKE